MSVFGANSEIRSRSEFAMMAAGLLGVCLCTLLAIMALASQNTAMALVAFLALPALFAALVVPDVLTLCVVLILYLNVASVAVRFHHVPYAVAALFPLLLLAPLGHYLIAQRQRITMTPAVPWIAVLLLVNGVGALRASDSRLAMERLFEFLMEGVLLYLLFINVIRTPTTLRRVIWVLLLCGSIMGALSLFQQVTGSFHQNYGGFAQMTSAGFSIEGKEVEGARWQARLSGPIGEQNRYAQIMLMLIPIGVFQAFGERSLGLRVLAVIATALAGIGCALTFSRGAAVAFFLLMLVMAAMRLITWRWLGVIVLAVTVLVFTLPQYARRIGSLTAIAQLGSEHRVSPAEADGAIKGRATEMMAAVLMFMDHPVLGVGPGMFGYHVHEYAEGVALRALEGNRQAHSLYLGVAAEHGIVGLICWFGIFYVTMRDLLRASAESHGSNLAAISRGLLLALVAYLATGLFLHLSYMRYLWFMLALGGAVSAMVTPPAGTRRPCRPMAITDLESNSGRATQ